MMLVWPVGQVTCPLRMAACHSFWVLWTPPICPGDPHPLSASFYSHVLALFGYTFVCTVCWTCHATHSHFLCVWELAASCMTSSPDCRHKSRRCVHWRPVPRSVTPFPLPPFPPEDYALLFIYLGGGKLGGWTTEGNALVSRVAVRHSLPHCRGSCRMTGTKFGNWKRRWKGCKNKIMRSIETARSLLLKYRRCKMRAKRQIQQRHQARRTCCTECRCWRGS